MMAQRGLQLLLICLTGVVIASLAVGTNGERKSETTSVRASNATIAACAALTSCAKCVENNKCVWCTKEKECMPGNWYGAPCAGWKYEQCQTDGLALLVGIGLLIALLVLITLGIIFCCVFCRRSTASYETLDEEAHNAAAQSMDTHQNPASAHPITDLHRQEMEEKYGLSKR